MEAPPLISPARSRSFWWLAVVVVLASTAAVLYLFNPSQYGFYPRCALYTTTGIFCPGCGSLRALHQLTHGHLITALRCNLLLVSSLPFAAVYFGRCVTRWLSGEPLPSFTISPRRLMALAAVAIIFTILRNIPFAPFIYLTPP